MCISQKDRPWQQYKFIQQRHICYAFFNEVIPIMGVSANQVHVIELFSVVCREHAPWACTHVSKSMTQKAHLHGASGNLWQPCKWCNFIHHCNMYWSIYRYIPFTLFQGKVFKFLEKVIIPLIFGNNIAWHIWLDKFGTYTRSKDQNNWGSEVEWKCSLALSQLVEAFWGMHRYDTAPITWVL